MAGARARGRASTRDGIMGAVALGPHGRSRPPGRPHALPGRRRKRGTRTHSVADLVGRPVWGATRPQRDRGDVPSRPDRDAGRCTVLAPARQRDSRAGGAAELPRAGPPFVTAARMSSPHPLLVLIPAFNEEDSIGALLDEVKAVGVDGDVLV